MLSDAFTLAGAALSLDRVALAAARETAGSDAAVLLLALVAGLSLTLGQCVVLFANDVSRRRFVLCVLLFVVTFVGGLLAWGISIWLIASYVARLPVDPLTVVMAVCLGQAPLLFGVLVLLPFFGPAIRRVLEAYSLVVVVAALSALFGLPLVTALAISGLGWALRSLAFILLQRPLAGMRLWLWQAASGRPDFVTTNQLSRTLAAGIRTGDLSRRLRP